MRTCRGEWTTTSCLPRAARLAKRPVLSPSSDQGPNAGNLLGTTRTHQPGASAGRPGGPIANVSGGVADSRPAQKGQPATSLLDSSASGLPAPGRRALAGAITTQRPETGSRRSSGGVSVLS